MIRKRRTPGLDTQRKATTEALDEPPASEELSQVSSTTRKHPKTTIGGLFVEQLEKESISTSTKALPAVVVSSSKNLAVVTLNEEEEASLLHPPQSTTSGTTSKYGPTSAPVHVRATTITDYNPNLCKDYNQTGYCGYGDSCIYLHDRTTYVSGDQLDKRWDAELLLRKTQQQQSTKPLSSSHSKNQEDMCGICSTRFSSSSSDIVKTRCGHFFCKHCAFERFSANKTTCQTCEAQTLGIFNDVKKI